MYRDRFRIGPALALGVLVMIGSCGQDVPASPQAGGEWSTDGCGAARVPRHIVVSGVAMPVTPPGLETVMTTIDQAGRAHFPESYAGVEVDQEQVRAFVYRVPSATFDDFIRKSAGDACIVVRDAAHSAAELAVWHDRVLADLPYWSHHDVRIITVGARHDGSGVEIGVRDVEKARQELQARYGAQAPLIVVPADPVHPLPVQTSRVAPPPGI